MKKALFSLMMLFSVTAVMGNDVVEVSTLSDLKRAINADNGAHILLTADIDAEDLEGTLCETFTGTIDGTINVGRGHAITSASSALFSRLKGATLKNIVISGFSISGTNEPIVMDDDYYPCYGFIACEATEGCRFENVLIEDCDLSSYCSEVGGIVGRSDGSTFVDCNIDNHSSIYSAVEVQNMSYHGGLVGLSDNDTFTRCVNSALVATAGGPLPYIGGIAGFIRETKMESCINSGLMVAFDDESESVSESYRTIYENYKNGSLPYTTVSHRGKEYIAQKLTDDMQDLLFYAFNYGGVAGFGTSSTFVDCVNISPCYYGYVEGGIVGSALECSFDRCINYASIQGRSFATSIGGSVNTDRGGIAGSARNPEINNCLNLGSFPGLDGHCGAIAQSVSYHQSIIRNCLSVAEGVPVFDKYESVLPELSNNYRLGNKFSEKNGVTIVTPEMLASGLVAYWLNKGVGNHDLAEKPWHQNVDNLSHPVLDPDADVVNYSTLLIPKTPISSCQQLKEFAERVNNGDAFENAELTNDIDMDDLTPGFVIGTEEHPYRGIFDGKGYTINKQNIAVQSGSAGTFGTIGTYAEIRNLTIGSDSQINGGSYGTGGIVGAVNTSAEWGFVTIENCGNRGTVNAAEYAGGILGKMDCDDNVKVYVNYCYNVGDIKVQTSNSALLCGYMKNSGVVTNSWSYAQLRTEAASGLPCKMNSEGQCYHFVGYDKTLDISNCSTFDSVEKVDRLERSKVQHDVFEYPSLMLKHGTFTYILNGYANDPATNTWQHNMGDYPVPGNKGLYHTRTVSSEYGTICLPYALKSNDDIQYYTFTSVESDTNEDIVSLHFGATEEVAASKPALFHVKTAGTYAFSDACDDYIFGTSNTDDNVWKMLGTFDQLTFENDDAKNIYYVSNNEIRNAKKITISPFRAYFSAPSIDTQNGAKTIQFIIEDADGSTTALQVVGEDIKPMHNAEIIMHNYYNLNGQRVDANHKGIVIHNGKKVMQ